ncbi:hypothetical protein JW711_00825 [Candidatus Woesearchaeota archaeon]|nr:hypothetical protein [Candidatus Woesearchaeota archaeon]
METMIVILLVMLSVIIILYATKFLGRTVKIITKIMLFIVVLLAILTVLVFKDIQTIKEDVTTKESLFLLQNDGRTYAGVGIKPVEEKVFTMDSFTYYTREDLDRISNELEEEGRAKGMGKAFIFTPNALNKSYELDLGVMYDQETMLCVLMSDEPYRVLVEKASRELNLSEKSLEQMKTDLERHYGGSEKIKGYLLAALVINYFQPEEMKLVTALKSQEVKVRPETISFKVIKYVPVFGIE